MTKIGTQTSPQFCIQTNVPAVLSPMSVGKGIPCPLKVPNNGIVITKGIEEGDRRQETGDRRKITWGF
ncbi:MULTISPECIES: hypothetical protein [unclassified Okeania]|uniref:hypothetical protein n=1 Tax=unclassified Okeania TaxID=2634635 RepID=UPI0013B66A27|nr:MULTISPECIES: hypothetical protein [unclassified Okeania]NET19455.1 hypothetical protein [Okeania sp. SIO1H5]NET94176.1 hypothetical protein [Okeania sp. SIO1H2]